MNEWMAWCWCVTVIMIAIVLMVAITAFPELIRAWRGEGK